LRCEGQADQCCIPAVGTTHDRDSVRICDAASDRPIHCVDEVVVHLSSPLTIACCYKRFAEPGRTTEVHTQDRIPTICKPLMQAVVTPRIARPGATMDE